MKPKSAFYPSFQNWPQATGILLFGSARPPFLGAMQTGAILIEASASGSSAWWRVYRSDPPLIDTDRYATSGTANSAGFVSIIHLKNDAEHHLTALPKRLSGMSAIQE